VPINRTLHVVEQMITSWRQCCAANVAVVVAVAVAVVVALDQIILVLSMRAAAATGVAVVVACLWKKNTLCFLCQHESVVPLACVSCEPAKKLIVSVFKRFYASGKKLPHSTDSTLFLRKKKR
jgi:hypothetical protein